MSAPENPPAFPNTGNPTWGMEPDHGMSLRDYFAGQVAGHLAAKMLGRDAGLREIAGASYEIADALLAERQKAGQS
jgi:hypothetical protein